MDGYKQIEQKLHQFSKKYYTNELIKGIILFISLGLLYFFFTLFIEYFLWLRPTARTILFWLFIGIEFTLLFRFIAFPIFKLIGLQKGISLEESSKIIGNHFPEVNDKLLNVLQLKKNTNQSDLLIASIAQKSKELQPIPFSKAIDFKQNTRYLKYAILPFLIFGITLFTGNNNALSESLNRVVHHRTAYTPPAPFNFYLKNNSLEVIQGKPLTVQFETKGEVFPEESKIYYNNQEYFLKNDAPGLFSYTFDAVHTPIDFYVEANGIQSQPYSISVIKTPTILNMSMRLLYPKYLRKRNKTINNTGNIIVPQGTNIQWIVTTNQTKEVTFIHHKKRNSFKSASNNKFKYTKRILTAINYEISSSNAVLKDYEKLQFSVDVLKDEHPTIRVKSNIDSISRGPAQFAGQISDDNGLQKLQLVYYDMQNPQKPTTFDLPIGKENIQTFYYQFPDGLNLDDGVDYELFFQVFDNDGVQGNKKTTSKKFNYRKQTKEEIEDEFLKEQKNYINNIENSLEKQQKNKKDLEKIQFDIQNKKNVNWNDQKKIQNFIKRQDRYKQMMQRQTEKLKENFSEKKEESESLQNKKEALKKRIDELKKLDKQEKLLAELKKMAEKLQKEDIIKKTKQISEQSKQQEKSLARILELTKRFYVEQKATQISNKLQELAKKQEALEQKNASPEEQEELNQEFDKIKKDIDDLKKDNDELKEPMDIPSQEALQKQTENEMKEAKENLSKQNKSGAKKNQKKAAKKMKEMSGEMNSAMEQMSSEMEEENMEDLRQILENLVTFSFQQEDLMNKFSGISSAHPSFGKNLKKQHQLKKYFEHIDDSLYVLSMRVPKISAKIQDELSIAHYNLDQSLDNFAESYFRNGLSNQRYIMTAANTLADMLSNILNAMQNPKMGMGKGKGKKGKSFSLPDIIEKQSDLLKKMKEGMKKGSAGKPKDGSQGKAGKNGKEGGEKKGGKKPGENEEMNGELYKIYKEQAALREQLENAIKEGKDGNGAAKKALKTMEDLENEILEKGFNQGVLNKMQNLNHQLLKLDKATFEQGKEKQRKANTNLQDYEKQKAKKLELKKLFYNQTEILNRQSLPLQQNYKKKVQEYFKEPVKD